ncbi:hypothetical protein LINPERPRIM_LOCUS11953 [Linum perenne]
MEHMINDGGGGGGRDSRVEELKRNVKERVTSRDKKNRRRLVLNSNKKIKNRRFLISVTIRGSVGPIRFVANQNDTVLVVIRACLKRYAREGRLPVIGFDVCDFLLYCPLVGPEALSPGEAIGDCSGRYFLLSKKQRPETAAVIGRAEIVRSSGCKVWLFKSLFV